ncbi:copper resistance protein CopC [Cohnella lubricantis]|uniref:Copper resistance protein CopC/CopD n=1 Tax=Cohnella lubricantis TaxID=2163172 RepID=A0A841TAP2_9BACL|nr:copper resistance protein CopC [Cohnella lubricantis]MBB6678364.1 copper resistance protein CopC/CopD [Cohnella lubricantis]MBP2116744.1 copper transport protein [Cohnella lubricantis]
MLMLFTTKRRHAARGWLSRCCALLFAALLISAVFPPGRAGAHAILEQATPAQDEQLQNSPPYVELLFNERLDSSAEHKVIVLDSSSRSVTNAKPERTEQGKGLKLALPALKDDHYTVSYNIISADGHPVSGAYVFTVGNPPPLPDSSSLDPHAQIGHEGHVSDTNKLTTMSFLFYAARIAYYAGLLIIAGLLFWGLQRGAAQTVRDAREAAIGFMGKFIVCATLAYVVLNLYNLTQGEPLSEWVRVLTQTTVGKLYAANLLLAFAALLLGGLSAPARLFWAAVALFVEAWNGHAAVYDPISYSVALDFVHLAAASVWAGGLLLLLLIWRKERPEAGRFAIVFSRWALFAFLALWLTGILSVLLFLPSLEYLFYTAWGKWLLAKVALSVLVMAAAFFIRLRLRKGSLPPGGLLRADFGLMAGIVLIVGVLTYQNPLPANQPLYYHEMGTDMHVTLQISPNAPGNNSILVKVWLPESIGQPKSTVLRLQPTERGDVGVIDVPLESFKDSEIYAFEGYVEAAYKANGPYLPFAGEWQAQVRVTDADGNELVRKTTFRIY